MITYIMRDDDDRLRGPARASVKIVGDSAIKPAIEAVALLLRAQGYADQTIANGMCEWMEEQGLSDE